MALGQKKKLAQEARRALSQQLKQAIADQPLARLAEQVCNIDLKAWNTLADTIVQFRNSNLGHGFQMPRAAERSLADNFVPQVERFVGLMAHLNRNMLVYADSRKMTKTATECVFRMLVHDNPIFPSNTFSRPKGSALDTLDEQEVYVWYSEPDGLLSLWPWVLFAPPGTNPDAVWFFDGTKAGTGIFKSMQVPGVSHSDAAAGAAVLKLMGRT
jgi:hypothetical protein